MPLRSAGILLYRRDPTRQVFLIHPGGPFWKNKDLGAWSIPKGLVSPGEEPLAAARREFAEETGFPANGAATYLGLFKQPSGKHLMVWILEGEIDPQRMVSNTFAIAWPPKSATMKHFPEADRGAWFGREKAMVQITKGQRPALEKFFALPDERLMSIQSSPVHKD